MRLENAVALDSAGPTDASDAAGEADEDGRDSDGKGERGRSTIRFPYAPLSDAERIANELFRYGGSATPDGIAKVMGQKSGSGAFRQKLSAARIFGFVSTRPGQVSLTGLGRAVIDPEKQAAARVAAFLNVELYKALFDKYQGDLLPPSQTLDTEIADLGVSPKQTSTARQIMFRSAEQAGFFARGANRLVRPDAAGNPRPADRERRTSESEAAPPRGALGVLEAPILAMLDAGEEWTPEQTYEYVDGLRKMRRALQRT